MSQLQNLPMFAAVGAAASCVASVTTETSNGEVQSKDNNWIKATLHSC